MMRLLAATLALLTFSQEKVERVLFDFEKAEEVSCWTPLELPGSPEPPVRGEASSDHVSSGSRSLKISFAGGMWPTIRTTAIPLRDDWESWTTFRAEVTAARTSLMGFRILQEKSSRDQGWDAGITRWEKTVFLKPGKNEVRAALRENYGAVRNYLGKVVAIEIYLYRPHAGESIYVDHLRLTKETTPISNPFQPGPGVSFKVLGTDLNVSGVVDLGAKLKGQWKKPEPLTVDQVEADFRKLSESLRTKHPRAMAAVFRDGENGYAGWRDAHVESHSPDGNNLERARNYGKVAAQEVFMRHRSVLMQVDLSAIPKGSTILAAQLLIVRQGKDRDPSKEPTMWVAEPCNRPWEESEVNSYEYARDKFWKEVGGASYGDDPDFLPLYVAHGPGTPGVNVLEFSDAVRFWTNGKHPNHGFMLHGDSKDYITAFSRDAAEVKQRPALLVAYEPPQ